mgnify:FL=1
MKYKIFLIVVFALSLQGFAQQEMGTKSKSFPAENKKEKPKKVVPPTPKTPPIKAPETIKPLDDFKVPKMVFVMPGEVVYRRNQDLGTFNTKAVSVNVKYRDAAFVDGDKVRVSINDKVVNYQVNLNGNYQGFQMDLVKGVNKIEFEALNEGSASPNTAEFKIYDEKGRVISSNQWNLGTGYKGTVVLVKE